MPRGFLLFVLIFIVITGLIAGALVLMQKDREIRTEIVIAAPPEAVWRVLTATAEYPSWNPFLVSLKGTLAHDEKLEVTVRPPGGSEMSFLARVLVATPNQELAWRGGVVVPGIFQGEHRFRLQPTAGGHTRFLHSQKFTGLLVGPVMNAMLDRTERGFAEMNLALKLQSEPRR